MKWEGRREESKGNLEQWSVGGGLLEIRWCCALERERGRNKGRKEGRKEKRKEDEGKREGMTEKKEKEGKFGVSSKDI